MFPTKLSNVIEVATYIIGFLFIREMLKVCALHSSKSDNNVSI